MQELQPTISALKSAAARRLVSERRLGSSEVRGRTVRPVLFSHSILLVSEDNSEGSFFETIVAVRWLMRGALLQAVPIKGAIAFGTQTADFSQSLHFGRPLIDAYELQDELRLYAIALHHSAEQYLIKTGMLPRYLTTRVLGKYMTPIKAGSVTHYLVACVDKLISEGKLIPLVSTLYETVSGSPRQYVDNTLEYAIWLKDRWEVSKKEQQMKSHKSNEL